MSRAFEELDEQVLSEDQEWAQDLLTVEYGELQAALTDHLRFGSQMRHPKRHLWNLQD
jgi:hypothetical protein